MVAETTIGIIIAGFSVGVAIAYNAYTVNQNTKARHYQMLKDADDRFNEIQNLNKEDPRNFFAQIANFGILLVDCVNEGVTPKNLLIPRYKRVIGESLWLIKNATKTQEENKEFIKFCESENIDPVMPSREIMSKGKFQSDSLTSLVFSTDETKDADIYNCKACKKMFGKKEEYKKHLDENHRNTLK